MIIDLIKQNIALITLFALANLLLGLALVLLYGPPSWRNFYHKHFPQPWRERLFLSSISFLITFIAARSIAYSIYTNSTILRSIFIRGIHIHHLVIGILILLLVGFLWLAQIGIGSAGSNWGSRITACLFGIGSALTLDEFALWLHLEDVYWLPKGRVSIDAIMLFGSLLSIGVWGEPFFRALINTITKLFKH